MTPQEAEGVAALEEVAEADDATEEADEAADDTDETAEADATEEADETAEVKEAEVAETVAEADEADSEADSELEEPKVDDERMAEADSVSITAEDEDDGGGRTGPTEAVALGSVAGNEGLHLAAEAMLAPRRTRS